MISRRIHKRNTQKLGKVVASREGTRMRQRHLTLHVCPHVPFRVCCVYIHYQLLFNYQKIYLKYFCYY